MGDGRHRRHTFEKGQQDEDELDSIANHLLVTQQTDHTRVKTNQLNTREIRSNENNCDERYHGPKRTPQNEQEMTEKGNGHFSGWIDSMTIEKEEEKQKWPSFFPVGIHFVDSQQLNKNKEREAGIGNTHT